MHLHWANCSNSIHECSVPTNNEAFGVFVWHFNWTYFWVWLWKSHDLLEALPCLHFFMFLMLPNCNLCLCWDGYLFIWSQLLLVVVAFPSNQSSAPFRAEITVLQQPQHYSGWCPMWVESSCQLQVCIYLISLLPLHTELWSLWTGQASTCSRDLPCCTAKSTHVHAKGFPLSTPGMGKTEHLGSTSGGMLEPSTLSANLSTFIFCPVYRTTQEGGACGNSRLPGLGSELSALLDTETRRHF